MGGGVSDGLTDRKMGDERKGGREEERVGLDRHSRFANLFDGQTQGALSDKLKPGLRRDVVEPTHVKILSYIVTILEGGEFV